MVSPILSGLGSAVIPRLVLLANHVISSEPAAVMRLKPFAGRRIDLHLRAPTNLPVLSNLAEGLPRQVHLVVTPAGLLEWLDGAPEASLGGANAAGLSVTVDLPDPLSAVRLALRRERPPVTIEGDAGLAEAVSWLMKNLRWDIEDDLARWLGTPPTQLLRAAADAVRQALARWRPGPPPGAGHGAF